MLPDPLFWNVHMYGVMIAVGVLSAFVVLNLYAKKKNLDSRFTDFMFYNAVVSVLVAFLSANLFQGLYNYIKYPEKGFHAFGEMTFLGGLIGAMIAFFGGYLIFRKKLTGRMIDFLPILPCCVTIAHGFGRIGCFFAGCCHGIHTGTALDMQFPKIAESVLPTQLYEAVFLLLLFAVLSLLLLKKNCIHTMSIYLIAYGVFRFAIEFVRDDERGSFLPGLTPSQFWSVVMVIIGIAQIFIMKKMQRKPTWAEAYAAPAAPEETEESPEAQSGAEDEESLPETGAGSSVGDESECPGEKPQGEEDEGTV